MRHWTAFRAGDTAPVAGDAVGDRLTVVELMVACGIAETKSAARRAIDEGGAYVNNVKVTDIEAVAGQDDFIHAKYLVLRRGKRTVGGIVRADH